jgi:hypothetical protein
MILPATEVNCDLDLDWTGLWTGTDFSFPLDTEPGSPANNMTQSIFPHQILLTSLTIHPHQINDAGPFWRTASTIPPSLISPEFAKDRSEMTNRPFEREGREAQIPEALSHVRMYFKWMEEKVLGDGREYILGGSKEPGLADVHAAWLFDWARGLAGIEGVDKTGVITEREFPRVWAWLGRYIDFVAKVREKDGRAETISDEDAVRQILGSELEGDGGEVDGKDPLGLRKGERVEMWPTDSGMNHHDKGRLVSLSVDEVVVESEVPGEGRGVLRIHYPRTNFKIVRERVEGKL